MSDQNNTPSQNNLKVLLIDDSKDSQILIRAFLKKLNLQLDVADDGLEGFEKMKVGGYHLVISDIELPSMGGHQIVKEWRLFEKNGNKNPIPVVGLSGHAEEAEIAKALSNGFSSYMVKPIKKADLLNEVAKMLQITIEK